MYSDADWARLADIPGNENIEAEPYRDEARRDAARLLHSPSFRRLQGKTQLFPGVESDFFRNRLTHSLEVGQIARSIASRLNAREQFLEPPDFKIHHDLMDFAGWCHDLGHPPFGHTGEAALDRSMRDSGGFEGNAQTLRILTRLEKRQHNSEHPSGVAEDGTDLRLGLNLTARSLAAIFKYDHEIPILAANRENANEIVKGYYRSERDIVRWIKHCVTGVENCAEPFKTIECQIMDIAEVSQFRGDEVVGELFRVLSSDEPGGNQLLPDDVRVIYDRIDEMDSKRVIADFIAGMTDRYAIEFFGRLRSENPQTIYKPL